MDINGSVAVVTGGASGIGFAAATRFARMGLRVCVADLGEDRLARAAEMLAAAAPGGGADTVGRVLFGKLGEVLGASFVIENRGGGAGTIGAAAAWWHP